MMPDEKTLAQLAGELGDEVFDELSAEIEAPLPAKAAKKPAKKTVTRYEPDPTYREATEAERIKELEVELAILRNEVRSQVSRDEVHRNRTEEVEAILLKVEEQERSGGDQLWYIHDTRKDGLAPCRFFTNATEPRRVLLEHAERTGRKFTGGGEPFVASREPALVKQ